jgi:hypothetical protein
MNCSDGTHFYPDDTPLPSCDLLIPTNKSHLYFPYIGKSSVGVGNDQGMSARLT